MRPAAESAFTITGPEISAGTNPWLIVASASAPSDYQRWRASPQLVRVPQLVPIQLKKKTLNIAFIAVGRAKWKPPHFSRLLDVLAWSNRPQSQHGQLNLIHKFDQPRSFKRSLYGEKQHSSFISLHG